MAGVYFFLIDPILSLLFWAIVISAILSWLIAFDVLNRRNQIVNTIWTALQAVTGPILEPFRRVIPTLGGVDISPVIALLLIRFLNYGVLRPLMT